MFTSANTMDKTNRFILDALEFDKITICGTSKERVAIVKTRQYQGSDDMVTRVFIQETAYPSNISQLEIESLAESRDVIIHR